MDNAVPIFVAAGAAVAVWFWSIKARERVDRISQEVCKELNLQRLDQSVTLRRLRLVRGAEGLALERVFSFEFSTTGADRRRGDVCLRGASPQWVRIDHPEGPIHIDIPKRGAG